MKEESGQALTEYVLLLVVIAGAALLMLRGVRGLGLGSRLNEFLMGSYQSAYTYGHPQAKGFSDGGPKYHPAASPDSGEGNGRIFISPKFD